MRDLAARLLERGWPIWLDEWNIEPGQDWDRTIDAALTDCATFLIVLSPDAVGSSEVRGELRSALNLRKRIVPVLLKPCAIPRQLQTTQYLDLSDAPQLTDALVDDLIAALGGEARPRGERWRDVQTALGPLSYLGRRLKAVGAAAVGALALLAVSGLLVEASYARLLGIRLPRPPAALLFSGVQFSITLLLQALVVALPTGALLLVVFFLGRAGRRLIPASAAGDALRRALGRPALLWAAQLATLGALLLVSLPSLARQIPLIDVAFNRGPTDARIGKLSDGGERYRAVALNVACATLVVGGLEAWRRRLHRKRQFEDRAQALLSLGLALPLYALVATELLLLPIGHGLLWLPARREQSSTVVSFNDGVRHAELKGKTFRLIDLRSTAPGTFYCPQGPRVWTVREEDIDSFAETTTRPLAQLLDDFKPLTQCHMPGRTPQEVAR